MIDVARVADLADIGADQWNRLLRDSDTNVVFLTYEWVQCWWNCLGSDRELFILVARKHGQLVGIAPLMLGTRRWGTLRYKILEFIGTGESDYCDFVVEPSQKKAVLRAILDFLCSQSRSWDVISLLNVPGQSATLSYVHQLLEDKPYRVRDSVYMLCPTLLIKDDTAFAFACTRKKSLRRHFNYFSKSGRLSYRTARTNEEILSELDSFFDQHIERRAIAGEVSKFHDPRVREFYRCLINSLLPPQWLKFGILKVDDTPIAYHLGFEYAGKFIWYKPTFNVDYLKNSPGEVLIKFLLEDAINNGMTEFDFTIGDEAFKRRFSNRTRENMKIEILGSTRIWLAISALRSIEQFAREKVPVTVPFLRRLRRVSKRARHAVQRFGILGSGTHAIRAITRSCLIDVKTVLVYRSRAEGLSRCVEPAGFELRAGQLSDARAFASELSPVQQKNLLSKWNIRMRDGDRLFVGEMAGRPAHYAWVSFKNECEIPEIDERVKFKDNTAYVYDCHSAEDYRGRGVYAAVVHRLTADLQGAGFEQVLIYCHRKNEASRKGIERAGLQPYIVYTRIKVCGISRLVQRRIRSVSG